MADSKGLDQIPVHLTPEMARILAAHAQLQRSLGAIEYPKSGRWAKMETAVAVLDALADYVAATCDEEAADDIIEVSSHTELLDDMITHFRQAKWGIGDRRLSLNKEGAAGATHNDAIKEFKDIALHFVDIVADQERANGRKDPVAEARRKVARAYQDLGLTIHTNRSGKSPTITARLLGNWEKARAKEQKASTA